VAVEFNSLKRDVGALAFRVDRLEGSVAIVDSHVNDVLHEMRNGFDEVKELIRKGTNQKPHP
jgi:hypothetical protein